MTQRLRVCLAQINTTVGDLLGNQNKILTAARQAKKGGAKLLLFPELTLTGYPPEDLLFSSGFVTQNLRALDSLKAASRGLLMVVGFVDRDHEGRIYNAAAVLSGGKIMTRYRKVELPNYGVFDEKRYFTPGESGVVIECRPFKIGVSICEDIWQKNSFVYRAPYRGGIDFLLNLSASPYHRNKQAERQALMKRLARRIGATVLYCNLVGGQDELVFDGGSLIVSPQGRALAQAKCFEEDLLFADIPAPKGAVSTPHAKKIITRLTPPAEIYQALVLGTRDYVQKNRFKKVLLGISGGIDSALVARIAVDALGAANVIGVTMPSRFTSPATLKDSKELAGRLGIACREISIEKIHEDYLQLLSGHFTGLAEDKTEENLQARIRGTLLMALSNKFGYLVLTTGNKSELATGYCTLYGDMAGGFAVIKDVPKTWVFKLARYANRLSPKNTIPAGILRRPPTAELRLNQKDEDSLPPYPVLDSILEKYVEGDRSFKEILKSGHHDKTVDQVIRLVDLNEYKRRQSPPGIKITPKAFGRDRRMPITNRFGH